jgi:hypothetical protein
MDAPLRANLGSEARRTAEGLAWPAIVGELEDIFHSVIERSQ